MTNDALNKEEGHPKALFYTVFTEMGTFLLLWNESLVDSAHEKTHKDTDNFLVTVGR
jgi:hypothetical protein